MIVDVFGTEAPWSEYSSDRMDSRILPGWEQGFTTVYDEKQNCLEPVSHFDCAVCNQVLRKDHHNL